MNKTTLALLAGTATVALSGAAAADEPVRLGDAQMDGVTAGFLLWGATFEGGGGGDAGSEGGAGVGYYDGGGGGGGGGDGSAEGGGSGGLGGGGGGGGGDGSGSLGEVTFSADTGTTTGAYDSTDINPSGTSIEAGGGTSTWSSGLANLQPSNGTSSADGGGGGGGVGAGVGLDGNDNDGGGGGGGGGGGDGDAVWFEANVWAGGGTGSSFSTIYIEAEEPVSP